MLSYVSGPKLARPSVPRPTSAPASAFTGGGRLYETTVLAVSYTMSSDAESLLDNDTLANVSNATLKGRAAASFEGLVTAYVALLLMAVVPIYVGSLRSIAYHANLKASGARVPCVRGVYACMHRQCTMLSHS